MKLETKHFSLTNSGISFAIRVVIGCLIVWWSLDWIHDAKKIWALISVIVVSDPDQDATRTNVISRLLNTVAGCIIGLILIYFFGTSFWVMIAGIAISVIISTSFKKYPSSWKLAPVTVVILMIPANAPTETIQQAMDVALTRTGEVLYGSFIAFLIGLVYQWIERDKLSETIKDTPEMHD